MPDIGPLSLSLPPRPDRRVPRRWLPPLLRRILLVNALPLALLVAALLYLDQYQNGLLENEVTALREQAKIYAGALGESAVRETDPENPVLVPDIARPLLRRLTDPTPNSQAKIYSPDGQVIADSRVREGAGGAINTQPLPPVADRGPFEGTVQAIYDRLLSLLPHGRETATVDIGPSAAGPDWQPDVKAELKLTSDQGRETPPYIRRTADNRLLVTVAEPIMRNRHTVGIVQLTRDAREVDDSLVAIRMSILGLFVIALVLTVMLSWYLIAHHRPPDPAAEPSGPGYAGRLRPRRRGAARHPAAQRRDRRIGAGAAGEFRGVVVAHGLDRAVRRRRGA